MRAWTTLREERWITRERLIAYRRILLCVTALIALGWVAGARGGVDAGGKPIGTDFLSFWSAARLALAGVPAHAYDPALHHAAETAAFGRDTGYASFFYPPPFLLLCLPLGLLPYFGALAAWLGATGWAFVTVMRRRFPELPGGVATLLAFPPLLVNAGHGQNGFLTATLLGGGLLLVPARPVLAGVLLGSLVIKPHLAILVPIVLLVQRQWRSFSVAALAAGVWCLAALLVLGPECWTGFLRMAPLARRTLEEGWVEPYKFVSVFGAVRLEGGPVPLAYALQAVAAALAVTGVCLAAIRRAEPRAMAAVAIAGTLLASPFLLDYDLTLMAVPLAWLCCRGMEHGFRPGERTLLTTIYLAPLVGRQLAMAIGLPLDLLATAGLWALVLRAALAGRARVPAAAMPPAAVWTGVTA